ncbi:MAG: hypothetical protein WBC44_11265 [Planctomycetaceae bacterium]
MATVIDTQAELEEFHRWLGDRLKKGKPKFTVAQCAAEFFAWREERDRLREELRPALERSLRGESMPLDADAMRAEATRQLAAIGIVDGPGED